MNTMDRGEISRPFPGLSTPVKQAIVINLDHLRQLMREFLNDMKTKGHATVFDTDSLTDWKFEVFLQWLQARQVKEANNAT